MRRTSRARGLKLANGEARPTFTFGGTPMGMAAPPA
jgi:hypothetical protein